MGLIRIEQAIKNEAMFSSAQVCGMGLIADLGHQEGE